MLFIIWNNNGEEYEEYRVFIDSIWKLKKKINIILEYNRTMTKMFFELYGKVIQLNDQGVYSANKDMEAKDWKQYTKLCKENSIEKFLITIGAKKIDEKDIQEIYL